MDDRKDLVLIVDDDEAVLATLHKVVKASGLEAEMVSSGEAALEKLNESRFDMILMDINMNGMDGFESVQEIRRRNITTPIIIVSGRKEDYVSRGEQACGPKGPRCSLPVFCADSA